MQSPSFPNLALGTKDDLAERLSGKYLTKAQAMALVNECLENHESLWKTHKDASDPAKQKFVRSAAGTNLGLLLKHVDRKLLAPYDKLVPSFIFGGLKGRSHVQAGRYIQGTKKRRTYRSVDVSGFFEQISEQRIFYFFYLKASCSVEVATILSKLCSVPKGPKGSALPRVLARGFATSSRLALWCNLNTFNRIHWRVKRRLKGHEPRMAVYVDDIGFSATEMPMERINAVSKEVEVLLLTFDPHQPLPINPDKSKTKTFDQRPEHLGMLMAGQLSFSDKTRKKVQSLKHSRSKADSEFDKKVYNKKLSAYSSYDRQLKRSSSKKNRGV